MSLGETARPPLDVLIAEDDCDVRLAVRQLLEQEGYSCAEAQDGQAAVDIAREQPPRLVLLDLMMPVVDGFAAAQKLRSDPLTHGTRIHCLTALDFPAARQAAQEAGCDGFLAKPFAPDDLLKAVCSAVYRLRPNDDAIVQAMERLRQALAAKVPGREWQWSQQLRGALADLHDALNRQAATMASGLLADGDLCRPTLTRQAAELRQEHHRLREQTENLLAQVLSAAQAFQGGHGRLPDDLNGSIRTGPVDFSAIRRAGERLVNALNRHLEAQTKLLLDSLNTDIGVGD
jgi:two-component system cell cycle response regulator DivK